MDNCKDSFGTPENCPELTLLTDEEMNSCTQPAVVPEKVEGECKSENFECTRARRGLYSH